MTSFSTHLSGPSTDASPQAAWDYAADFWQRAVLFTDILRRRGNMYLEHLKADQPPVLVFAYEMVLDGRHFDRPVNYAIVRILDRRGESEDRRQKQRDTGIADRRENPLHHRNMPHARHKRPIVVIDPRAGHGPGIGGSKMDSQIGVALNYGHPVYFILFFTDPEPGQTLSDVQHAEVQFLEEVVRRHPEAEKPAVIGNCQAGWAAALIGADRPDVTGPMVFNGSPLSYWGGVEGANPMRYRGGLCGGVWLSSLWSDLGNGKFDGAHLVANFESLNPANTLWTKQYNLWSHVDAEAERYLNFEKWWGGFFKMTREEIHFIVDSLFVGNELEKGYLELDKGRPINLKNFKDPIVVFASKGDNITPPQQALNWIYKVYGTVDEIKRNGQVIVYILHEKVGHLGIFVSGSVAKKEHKEILGIVDMIEFLAPGLYEMIITEAPSKPWTLDSKVTFEERDMSDILSLDDGLQDEAAFPPVSAISRFNDRVYQTFFAPWVRATTTEWAAELMRQCHPLRMQRYLFSDLNPFMAAFGPAAKAVKADRHPPAAGNPFLAMEKRFSDGVQILLDTYRELRDGAQESLFKAIYDNPWMKSLFPECVARPDAARQTPEFTPDTAALEADMWETAMRRGGFAEGAVRIIMAVALVNHRLDKRQYTVAESIFRINDRLKRIKPDQLKWLVKEQAAYLRHDFEMALEALTTLLPTSDDRIEAVEIANSIATADMDLDSAEQAVLGKIFRVLAV